MKSLSALFVSVLALEMVIGCLENPGPDSRLGLGNHPYYPLATAYTAGGKELSFEFKQDSGKTWLRVANRSYQDVDSAVYFLQVCNQYFDPVAGVAYHQSYPGFYNFRQPPPIGSQIILAYEGRVGKLKTLQTADIGPINIPSGYVVSDHIVFAAILESYGDSTEINARLGGRYSGTYLGKDSTSEAYSGMAEGIIDATGEFTLVLSYAQGKGLEGDLIGHILSDSSVAGMNATSGIFVRQIQSLLKVKFSRSDRGLDASFHFSNPSNRYLDSLSFHLERSHPQ